MRYALGGCVERFERPAIALLFFSASQSNTNRFLPQPKRYVVAYFALRPAELLQRNVIQSAL
jgi:hypothetical protein